MGKVIEFPTSRILLASAESFAARTRPDWDTGEAADEILRSMAGMPIPRLTISKIYDLDKDTLLDIAEQLHSLTARLMDFVERDQ